ncbi:MAG: Fe-S cluster assembly protein SufD [Chloroflexi bacterium]|nr:Fe-S cluster assembly protein SufD [Chloroflexota bacterium]
MTTETLAPQEHYVAQFEALQGLQPKAPAWLADLRRQAAERFRALGFPTARKGNEAWKYTNVAPIAREAFAYGPGSEALVRVTRAALRRLAPSSTRWRSLVFINGRFAPALSALRLDAGLIQLGNLSETLESHEATVRAHLARHAAFDQDGFVALNTAFLHDGAFVRVTGEAPEPVHVIHVAVDTPSSAASYPRALIIAEPGSRLTLVESFVSLAASRSFTDAATEVVVEEGAAVNHYTFVAQAADAYHVGTTQAVVGRDARYRSWSFTTSGALVRNTLNVLLDAPGAECHLNGLYITSGSQHVDNTTFIDHARPQTTSRENYKGILDGKSRAVFIGKVLVRPDAQKADAHQINRNLVLSEGAEVDTKPSLEIFADDVKCAHGATAGQLDEEALFYLMSRGLDGETARRALVRGFAGEVLDTVTLPPVKRWLERSHIGRITAGGIA